VDVTLKLIRQFITDSAKRLSSQLSDLEGNIAQETADIRASYEPVPAPVFVRQSGGTYTTGQAVMADTRQGNVSIKVAAPASGRPGWLYVRNIYGFGNFVEIALVPPALVDLSTSYSLPGVTAINLYFDGTNFWP
jgi:hypothetical protein